MTILHVSCYNVCAISAHFQRLSSLPNAEFSVADYFAPLLLKEYKMLEAPAFVTL